MVMGKLGILFIALTGFFGLFVFGPFYDQGAVQGGVLIAVLLASVWRTSCRETWGLIKFCIPFVLTLMGFGVLFHLTHFMGREDWLQDSLIKALVFPSSLMFLKLLLTFITYLDLLRLPLAMHRRVDLITFKAAFSKGGRIMGRFKFFLDTYPEPVGQRKALWILRKYASLILALYLYLYEEIANSRLVLENRLRLLNWSAGRDSASGSAPVADI